MHATMIVLVLVGTFSYHCNVIWTQRPSELCAMDQTARWRYVMIVFNVCRNLEDN